MEAGSILGIIIGIVVATIFNGLILWIIAKMGLGIVIEKFGSALLTALLVAVIGYVMVKVTADWKGMFSGAGGSTVLHIIGTALLLIIVDKILPGMRTKGIMGAIIAAIALGIIGWLLGIALSNVIS